VILTVRIRRSSRPDGILARYKPTVPYIRQNHFGGAVGGPVLKKKMFFYFDYDQIIDHASPKLHPGATRTRFLISGRLF
jgi:hypothetical protein